MINYLSAHHKIKVGEKYPTIYGEVVIREQIGTAFLVEYTKPKLRYTPELDGINGWVEYCSLESGYFVSENGRFGTCYRNPMSLLNS